MADEIPPEGGSILDGSVTVAGREVQYTTIAAFVAGILIGAIVKS